MATISLRVNADDEKIIKEYAKSKNISVSALLRDAVFEKIEDEIDLNLYKRCKNIKKILTVFLLKKY